MNEPQLVKWQWRVLPIIEGILLALATLFVSLSCAQLFILQDDIKKTPQIDLKSIEPFLQNAATVSSTEAAKMQTAITLESFALQQHYHQANALLMARTWARYLGFTTGMILALIGASFILGQLQTARSQLEAKTPSVSLSLMSSSPGIILVSLGTILMLATVLTNHTITTTYQPLYLGKYWISSEVAVDSSHVISKPELPVLPDIKELKARN